ncbi:uncharacterized protein LOC119347708 [Triticum dicoccoides]|uniref:uncharacterized protein LOC119347708 n=1 Tax=Triticum dicoccoides TaxID=85692 RepID=UPI00188E5AFE|nr:uncharacterized protein LOC119347708 [Triticum dicoccoides]
MFKRSSCSDLIVFSLKKRLDSVLPPTRACAILKFRNSIKSSRCMITTPGQCLLRLQKISSFQGLNVTNRLAELHGKKKIMASKDCYLHTYLRTPAIGVHKTVQNVCSCENRLPRRVMN